MGVWELDDQAGTTFDLQDNGIEVTEPAGVGMPPILHKEQMTAFNPGALFRGIKVDQRVITLSQIIHEATFLEYLGKRLDLAEIIKQDVVADDTQTLTLRYTGATITLEIPLVYDSGFERAGRIPNTEVYAIRFIAYDPFWKELSSETRPLIIGGNITIVNKGTASAFPIITVTGPGTVTQIKNVTTGDELNFDSLVLASGEVLTIDLSPFLKTFTTDVQGNVIGSVDTGSAVGEFRLLPGENQITVNAGAGASADMTFLPCHWSLDAAENVELLGFVDLAAYPSGQATVSGILTADPPDTIGNPFAATVLGQATVTGTLST